MSRPASGSFVFQRPGKFIWIYLKPYQQQIQSNGDRIYLYDKDLNQVTIRKVGNALSATPAAILFGNTPIDKLFVLKNVGLKNGLEWLEATPKARDSAFEKIGIGMRHGLPEAMELYDSFGQVSLLTFTKFQKNPAIKPGAFVFVPPAGADVLRQ